jgi:hypothetical protein
VHDIISRDIRKFIQNHGRYRFMKLYELTQQNASLDYISDLLEIDHISIMHWKTIFEMIGSDGIPKFDTQHNETHQTKEFELFVNENPAPVSTKQDRERQKKLFRVY